MAQGSGSTQDIHTLECGSVELARLRGFVTWDRVDRTLRAANTLWLASTRPDGRPHAMPVWFTWDGKRLYFATHRRSQKARNLEGDNWAVLHAGDGDDALIIEGRADLVTDKTELYDVDQARGHKYVDPHSGTRDTILQDDTLVFRVAPQRVMAWAYGDISTRTDWRSAGP